MAGTRKARVPMAEQPTASQMQKMHLENSHTIEVSIKDTLIRINNDADPVLVAKTLHLLREFSC